MNRALVRHRKCLIFRQRVVCEVVTRVALFDLPGSAAGALAHIIRFHDSGRNIRQNMELPAAHGKVGVASGSSGGNAPEVQH